MASEREQLRPATRRVGPALSAALALSAGVLLLASPSTARAGKASWLDDVVRRVVRETEVGGRAVAHGSGAGAKAGGRLLAREADEGFEALLKRSDDLARSARKLDQPAEALLDARFGRLLRPDADSARAFKALAPAEKRLVVEMGETARVLARRFPGEAEPMIRKLGVEGMTAVRVYGDDVAEVIVKEGPESIGVLRKAGRGGWDFFTGKVLPNKKKLAAAGVLALFMADPDRFIDSAGRVTEYAVRQFSKAGIDLAGAVSQGAAKGLESTVGRLFASYGLDSAATRKLGMGAAGVAVVLAAMVLLGLPVRWLFRPLLWPLRLLRRGRGARAA